MDRPQVPDVRLPAPNPADGWARSVLRVQGGVIDPADGGLWHQGALCPEAALYRWRRAQRGGRGTCPSAAQPLAGRHLWGGTLFFHFGHFLAESLQRLWGAADSGAQSILFTPERLRGKRPDQLAGYQKQILERLGITLPVRIVYDPLQVEDLIIPGPGFGLGVMATGTPEFRDFARRLDPGPAAGGAKKLYISRTALHKKTGSVLAEQALERMLAAEGFAIYHPQRHSIADQLATFRNATHLLGPDGSAFHLAGFITQPHQTFTLIKRRSAKEYITFFDQLVGAGADVAVIDAVAADWIRPGKTKADDMSWGELDFAALSVALLERGLIDRPLPETAPPFDAEMDEIAAIHNGAMTRIPVAAA
ncbi:glycosyltransferase family 61 protein [Falsirhodobacter halotolerans]|uniref:glycosyltransferase family 61 protein n=1 Tax=Falsirhodobacter halotolerans TaxID=1146892 RepID=UPI001FCF90EB|nr:glycosyltransferase 61 family protein [Falsirhodobacter halotolerans]MCJ8138979.1 glycosyltransferase family 61 protein [Falsirhodobacter halotolerans]